MRVSIVQLGYEAWIPDSSFLTSGMTMGGIVLRIARTSSYSRMWVSIVQVGYECWIPDSSFLTSGMTVGGGYRIDDRQNRLTRACVYPLCSLVMKHGYQTVRSSLLV